MTAFRPYLAHRIAQLEADGQTRAASLDAIAQATGRLTVDEVDAFFAGHAEVEDLDLARRMGVALGLDETETVEVAGDGQMIESYARLLEDGDAFEGIGGDLRLAGGDRVLGVNEFIYSTGAEARDGDMIDTPSWRFGGYLANPVVLRDHDVRTVVGVSDRPKKDLASDRVTGSVTWDMAPDNADGQLIARQHHEKIRRGVSVRWLTGKRVAFDQLPKDDRRYRDKARVIHTAWGNYERMGAVHFDAQLLEVSSVSIPSDPRALQIRGLGPQGGQALRVLDPIDPAAATDLRESLRAALLDAEVWADPEFRRLLSGTLRALVHTDKDLRAALRALSLTNPTPSTDDATALLRWAQQKL